MTVLITVLLILILIALMERWLPGLFGLVCGGLALLAVVVAVTFTVVQ